MDNTAETPTKAAGIFKLGQSAFLHTTTGRCVSFAAGCAAMFTAIATKDAGLAAACAALFFPAVVGGLIGSASETAGRLTNTGTFYMAIACSTAFGMGIIIDNDLQSLPEMKPDMPVMTTAKELFCGDQKMGWIKAEGQKLNCGS